MSSKKRAFFWILVLCALCLFGFSLTVYRVYLNHIPVRSSLRSDDVLHTTNIDTKNMAPTQFFRRFLHGLSNFGNDVRADTCDACFKNDFNYVINRDVCGSYDEVDLLVLIMTAPKEAVVRGTIRDTWGSLCTKDRHIACVFILGLTSDVQLNEKIKSESSEHSDIVQLDFKESYGNLTYKTMSGFRWSRDFCSKARFVMKADGDMYINLELLPTLLSAVPRGVFIGGNCWGEQSPHRSKSSKWYVSFQNYPHKNFPPICSGTAYVISFSFLEGLMAVSQNLPFFHLEDVFVGMAAKSLGVRPVSIKGFNNMRAAFTPCSYRNEVMTSHYLDPFVLRRYWKMSRNCVLQNRTPKVLYVFYNV